ncbi:hypothetical protein [Paraliobacillus sp. X-1268]|uniref:hypothetical protein n=1 Tax=Paraliobacillus sp. X-1268 TaxID=2213193 RepID=UPI000E3E53F4|nr:hypothetical protein [Paraliobacillus sp. X-1268]
MAIITSEDLKNKINEYNVIPLEVSILKISNQIYLEIDEFEDFLKYAIGSGSQYVYYHYTYYNSEEYIIPIDWYSDYSTKFNKVGCQHNQHIETLDFKTPKSLTLFILQNGTLVGVILDNPWIESQEISRSEEAMELIENEFYSEVKEISETKKNQKQVDESNLREIIFKDPEFRFCKNQELRYWYIVELLEKENMMKYSYLVEPYGVAFTGKVKIFMDKTWELYKERQK